MPKCAGMGLASGSVESPAGGRGELYVDDRTTDIANRRHFDSDHSAAAQFYRRAVSDHHRIDRTFRRLTMADHLSKSRAQPMKMKHDVNNSEQEVT